MATTQTVELIRDQTPMVSAFVADKLGFRRGFASSIENGQCTAIGVMWRNVLIAGCVYHNYQPEAGVVEISAASISPRWLTFRTIHELLAYPFDALGCQLVVLRVSIRNTRMIDLAVRLGFLGYTIPRLRGRNEDEVIFTLRDEDWRSGRLEAHEQRERRAA
jgi:RimJ/RimL family protein N-acetyltransferase